MTILIAHVSQIRVATLFKFLYIVSSIVACRGDSSINNKKGGCSTFCVRASLEQDIALLVGIQSPM